MEGFVVIIAVPRRRLIVVALVLAGVVAALVAWGCPPAAHRTHTTRAATALAPLKSPPVHAAPRRVVPAHGVPQTRRAVAQRALADLRDLDTILRREHLRAGTAAPVLRELTRYVTLLPAAEHPAARPRHATTPRSPGAVPVPGGGSRAAIAIRYALAQLGKPYVWGAAGPRAFDCSGLVMRAWGAAGVSLPHYTHAIWQIGRRVTRSQLRPGDLVYPHGLGHVQLYIGGGKVIEAPHTGADVRIRALTPHAFGYLRVAPEGT